jgi:hypothetical protein
VLLEACGSAHYWGRTAERSHRHRPQHFLYFRALPQGHGSLRRAAWSVRRATWSVGGSTLSSVYDRPKHPT